MKIEGTVFAADDCGDYLKISLQGPCADDPAGAPWRRQDIQIPANSRNMKAYHIGRRVEIEIKPK